MNDSSIQGSRETIGVVVVHGVTPHPRYEIQDLAASNLRQALQDDPYWGNGRTWQSSVVNRPNLHVAKSCVPQPTISRVEATAANSVDFSPCFDVVESYWSPIDKGKTSFSSVASWLLRSVFVPLNTGAHYASRFWKTAYDFGLIFTGVAAVVAFLLGSLFATLTALTRLITLAGRCTLTDCPSAWNVVLNPERLTNVLSLWTLGILGMGVVGAFLTAQGIKAVVTALSQSKQLQRYGEQRYERWLFIALTLICGLLLLVGTATVPVSYGGSASGGWVPAFFVLAAMLFVGGRTIAQSWIVNFFGDVQIYTTRNENSDFFAMREAILERVTETIVSSCSNTAAGAKAYDRVYVLAHSLGSTIAMDALIRFFDLCEQDPKLKHSMKRIRAFVTFGTSLEKTKFFFDVDNPTPSLALEQWNGALYGTLFTPNVHELIKTNEEAAGILWLNNWYFLDAVCNKINSYRSFVRPDVGVDGNRSTRTVAEEALNQQPPESAIVAPIVALNQQGTKGFVFPEIIPHGEYLNDPWFWASEGEHLGVIDVLAGHDPAVRPRLGAIPPPSYQVFENVRYSVVSTNEAARFPDHYKVAQASDGDSIRKSVPQRDSKESERAV